jgi:hypothetical protein
MDPQTIVCENCGRTIGRLEQPRRWQAHLVCHECHDRLARQASGLSGPQTAPAGPGAAGAAPPSLGAMGADTVRWRESPSWIPYLPLYSLFVILALVSLWLGGALNHYFLILFPTFAILLAGWEMQRRSVKFTITTKRVVAEHGILGKERKELHISDIRQAIMDQTFWGRIVGIGTIKIETAANTGVEVAMHNVPNPSHVLELLNELRG